MKKRIKLGKKAKLSLKRKKTNSNFWVAVALVVLAVSGLVYFFISKDSALFPQAETRDMYKWPFDKNSPWNMPIGSNAQYEAANLGQPSCYMTSCRFFTEKEYIFLDPNAPLRNLQKTGGSCGGGSADGQVRIPDGVNFGGGTENDTGGALRSDNTTVKEWYKGCRNSSSTNLYAWTLCSHSLTGSGVGPYCGHGGSGLSAVGGSIRTWELAAGTPIRHTVKLTLSATLLNNDGDSAECRDGWRWPAQIADNGWNTPGGTSEYSGKVKNLCMGSLLALPPSSDCDAMVANELSRRVCAAMRDYGAYVVDIHPLDDDCYDCWRPFALNGEPPVDAALNDGDMIKLISALQLISNNSSNNIGGGGTPRVPLAPDFGATIPSPAASTAPSPVATQQPITTPTPTPRPATPIPTPVATPQPSVPPPTSGSGLIEGETFKINSGYIDPQKNVFSDSSASGGKGLILWSPGDVSTTVIGPMTSLVLRLKADNCVGSPVAVVKVDGQTVLNKTITNTTWQDSGVSLNLANGTHTISVGFSNDRHDQGVCDRNLRLDRVTVGGSVVVPPVGTVIEAETLKLNSGYKDPSNNVFNDSAASGGKGFIVWSSGNATVGTTAGFTKATFRVRADVCQGDPKLTIKIDGQSKFSQTVGNTGWHDITVDFNATAGTNHTLLVELGNDLYRPGTCDRNLRFDKITLQ